MCTKCTVCIRFVTAHDVHQKSGHLLTTNLLLLLCYDLVERAGDSAQVSRSLVLLFPLAMVIVLDPHKATHIPFLALAPGSP